MINISINLYQTLAIGVAALLLGQFLKKKISVLEKFCIPAPVIGGFIISIIVCILYVAENIEIEFDNSLQEVCMVFFFTSVGFQADIRLIKTGGKKLLMAIVLLIVLVISQNIVSIGLAKTFGLSPILGICTGSVSMAGGHGTSAAYGDILKGMGFSGAVTVSMAAATYGLIMGSLIGGPIANSIIRKKNLHETVREEDEKKPESFLVIVDRKPVEGYSVAAFQLAMVVGIGTIVSNLLSKTGITLPVYMGAMLIAAILRNIGEFTGKIDINMDHIADIGNIMLPIFLGIAMITLKIWELFSLAIPLLILLLVQTVFMIFFARFIVYPCLGKDYDAAVMCAGFCGFGMGATPNAMANMKAICNKYGYSFRAFMIIPIVGAFFSDFINSTIITIFINLI